MLNTFVKIIAIFLLICTVGMVLLHSRIVLDWINGEEIDLSERQRCWYKRKRTE